MLLLKTIFNFFFPQQCLFCGKIITNRENIFCNKCKEIIDNALKYDLSEKKCSICSRILISEIDICTSCRNRKYLFEKNISLWDYNETIIKKIIHSYKFNNKKILANYFIDSIFFIYTNFYNGLPVIPAPCSRNRLKKYGWDHMKHVGIILSKKYNIPVFNVFTKKNTRDQKKLNFRERQTELLNKINITKNNIKKCMEKYDEVIILDDVFTTGATANYCTELLLKEGIKKVFVLTFALD
jgi:competence protein ComFC